MEILKNESEEIYRTALQKWGIWAQTNMVFEEMSELQKELCKNLRGADNEDHIAEEIADVLIMLEQMITLYGCEKTVCRVKEEKIRRLEKRIKG